MSAEMLPAAAHLPQFPCPLSDAVVAAAVLAAAVVAACSR